MTARGLARLALIAAALVAPTVTQGESYGAFVPTRPQIVVQGPLPPADAIFAWSPDSRLLASVSAKRGSLQIWDTRTGNLINALRLPIPNQNDTIYSTLFSSGLSFSPSGTMIVLNTKFSNDMCGFYAANLISGQTYAMQIPKTKECITYSDARPPSKSGLQLVSDDYGETIIGSGRRPVRLAAAAATNLIGVEVNSAGSKVALLENDADRISGIDVQTTAEIYSLAGGNRTARLRLTADYLALRWLAGGRYLLTGGDGRALAPGQTLVVDAATSQVLDRAPFRCFTVPYGTDGTLISGRSRRCAEIDEVTKGLATPGLWVRPPGGAWRAARATGLGAPVVETLAATPDRRRAVIGTRRTIDYERPAAADKGRLITRQTRVLLIDGDLLDTGAAARTLPVRWNSDNERLLGLQITPDGRRVLLVTDQRMLTIDTASGRQSAIGLMGATNDEVVRAIDGEAFVTSAWNLRQALAYGFDGTRRGGVLDADGPIMSAGFLAGGRIGWTATFDGTLRFYDRTNWSLAVLLQHLGSSGFVAYDSAGRYDSALGPDSNAFRWLFPDDPLRSLGGQTFMRDYLEPQLYARTLACVAAGDCAVALPPPPPVGALNRTLPAVRIARVRPGRDAATAIVDVEAASVDAPAANGRTRSGVYDLRLFRDGKLVGQSPYPREASRHGGDDGADGPPAPPAAVIAGWRQANRVPAGRDGIVRRSFTVRLPTGWNARTSRFTAYAFNDDRVKSDTARLAHTRPRVWPARPRAYILTIGIDAYRDPSLSLGYAAADADLLGERLARVAGHAVRELRLRGRAGHAAATRQAIADAIALLGPGDHRAERARLRALGVDAAGFDTATPDDLVIISYAGHGWADARGRFYLVPQDGRLFDGFDTLDATDGRVAGDPDPASLISAARLTDWLRPVDAGEAAIIIDACQSAASVAAQGFKPGPMGDRGLGQLAYDKGIRILVASRGDQKAREDARLGHGLLTAALGRDGLDGQGFGHADIDGDGRITLDEWLRYAVARLPALGAEVAARRTAATGRDFVRRTRLAPARTAEPVQQPALFDFNTAASPVVLGHEPATAQMRRLARQISDRGRSVAAAGDRVKAIFSQTAYPELAAAVLLVLGFAAWLVRSAWRRVARWRTRAVDTATT